MNCVVAKPFECKHSGCNLSFTTEDHLSVHIKNHEKIILNIENKVFHADETPTPTTLIKNCEEVGLFEDLQNVNPFDETFRRAVETKSNTLLNNIKVTSIEHFVNEDTLHTPQVFPNPSEDPAVNNCSQRNCDDFQTDNQKVILTTEYLTTKRKTSTTTDDSSNDKPTTKRQKSLTEIVLKSNATKTTTTTTKPLQKIQSASERILIAASPVSTLKSISPTHTISLIQPQNITWQSSSHIPILPKNSNILTDKCLTLSIKDKIKAIISNNNNNDLSKQNSKSTSKSNSKPLTENEDNLERRRAAAVRYRKKKHKEQCDLRKRNTELLAENLELKSIIKQLQEVLQTHKNCDLTKSTLKSSPNGITAQLLTKSIPTILIPASTIVMNIPKLIIKNGVQQEISSSEI